MNRMWSVLTGPYFVKTDAALDNRQQIALHALPGNIRAVGFIRAGDLVDLVEKNDAGLLDALDGGALNLVTIDQLLRLLREEHLSCIANGQLARFPAR